MAKNEVNANSDAEALGLMFRSVETGGTGMPLALMRILAELAYEGRCEEAWESVENSYRKTVGVLKTNGFYTTDLTKFHLGHDDPLSEQMLTHHLSKMLDGCRTTVTKSEWLEAIRASAHICEAYQGEFKLKDALLLMILSHLIGRVQASKAETVVKEVVKSVDPNEELLCKIDALTRKLQEKDKAIAAAEAASKRELKRVQSQLDDALEECDRLQSLIKETDEADDLEDVECAVPLPDKGVCMVGGHPDLVSKVRKLYPKWKYVPVGAYPDSYGGCEIIIVAIQSIPHKQYWHVKYNAGKSQRLLCTHKSGLASFLNEARALYNK